MLFAVLFFLLEGCSTTPEVLLVKEADVKKYDDSGSAAKLSLPQREWWKHYKRALELARGYFWEEAEINLRETIRQRENDQRRARTYGMNFIDYFPHCELGVVLYNMGRMEEAIQNLTASLAAVKYEKAALFLDRARKDLIIKKGLDKHPPEIASKSLMVCMVDKSSGQITERCENIKNSRKSLLKNVFSVIVRGIARDDTFVRHITVGTRKIPIDLSAQEIPFGMEVPLVSGKNKIPLRLIDLTGKIFESFLSIHADHIGPVIRIELSEEGPEPNAGIPLRGYVVDDSGVAEWGLDGQKYPYDGEQELEIRKIAYFPPDKGELVVMAKDIAGNVTSATIILGEKQQSVPASASDDNLPPEIQFTKPKERKTHLNYALIEGKIQDNHEVKNLFINGKQLLKAPGWRFFFSRRVPLREGENIVNVEGTDISGNSEIVTIRITREASTEY